MSCPAQRCLSKMAISWQAAGREREWQEQANKRRSVLWGIANAALHAAPVLGQTAPSSSIFSNHGIHGIFPFEVDME